MMSHQHEKEKKKKEVVRRRWKILAHAIGKDDISTLCADDELPIDSFKSFDLIHPKSISLIKSDVNANWFEYTTQIFEKKYSVYISHPIRRVSLHELVGFNNTGNICVWPSEEVLAYLSIYNIEIFSNKSVLELGGGMTCLAGLFIAKYSNNITIELTDGNGSCIDNVRNILRQNVFPHLNRVSCSVLRWDDFNYTNFDQCRHYDIIISADCTFFDESRSHLLEAIWKTMNENGIAFVMAPNRKGTFDKFCEEAKIKGFICEERFNYNDEIWNRRHTQRENCTYDEEFHYPLLSILRKSDKTELKCKY